MAALPDRTATISAAHVADDDAADVRKETAMTDATTTQAVKVLYTAAATVTGGRRGRGATSDNRLAVDFSSPTELGGDGGPGTNPEQLFALGYAACFQNAMLGVARRMHLVADDSTVTSRVGIGLIGEGRLGLTVELHVTLPSIEDRAVAKELVEGAHKRCPYSNAVRGNVAVAITID
jgi:Ohr subfamily peroxiredoxin